MKLASNVTVTGWMAALSAAVLFLAALGRQPFSHNPRPPSKLENSPARKPEDLSPIPGNLLPSRRSANIPVTRW